VQSRRDFADDQKLNDSQLEAAQTALKSDFTLI